MEKGSAVLRVLMFDIQIFQGGQERRESCRREIWKQAGCRILVIHCSGVTYILMLVRRRYYVHQKTVIISHMRIIFIGIPNKVGKAHMRNTKSVRSTFLHLQPQHKLSADVFCLRGQPLSFCWRIYYHVIKKRTMGDKKEDRRAFCSFLTGPRDLGVRAALTSICETTLRPA